MNSQPRAIVLTSCEGCPSKGHRGGFGSPAYVPYCGRTLRDLPHTLSPGASGTRLIASYTGEIPEWCPHPLLSDAQA